jgi:hypothetical protein
MNSSTDPAVFSEHHEAYLNELNAPESLVSSPSGNFRIRIRRDSQDMGNFFWNVTHVEVWCIRGNYCMRSFTVNDTRFHYSFQEHDGNEYLIFSEDRFGGQSIMNLSNGKYASYSSGHDDFIWLSHELSADGQFLSVRGHYFACPQEIKVYHFDPELRLPLKEAGIW